MLEGRAKGARGVCENQEREERMGRRVMCDVTLPQSLSAESCPCLCLHGSVPVPMIMAVVVVTRMLAGQNGGGWRNQCRPSELEDFSPLCDRCSSWVVLSDKHYQVLASCGTRRE